MSLPGNFGAGNVTRVIRVIAEQVPLACKPPRCSNRVAVRIRGSQFFRDPDSAIKPVLQTLSERGILPKSTVEPTATAQSSTDLVDRVKRRAREIFLLPSTNLLMAGPDSLRICSMFRFSASSRSGAVAIHRHGSPRCHRETTCRTFAAYFSARIHSCDSGISCMRNLRRLWWVRRTGKLGTDIQRNE